MDFASIGLHVVELKFTHSFRKEPEQHHVAYAAKV